MCTTNDTTPSLTVNYLATLDDPAESKKRGSLQKSSGEEYIVSVEEMPSKSAMKRVRSFPKALLGMLAVCFFISLVIWPVGFFITGSSAMTVTGIVFFSISVTGFAVYCLANYIGACVDKANKIETPKILSRPL